MKKLITSIITVVSMSILAAGAAMAEPAAEAESLTEDEIRSRNAAVIEDFLYDEMPYYAEDAVRSMPFFPPTGAYWKGIDDIQKNHDLNAVRFGDPEFQYINIYPTTDPCIFWVEAGALTEGVDMSLTGEIDEQAGDTYVADYIYYFEFNDEGKVVDYREYFSPIDLYPVLGIETPEMPFPEYAVGREEIYGDEVN